MLLLAFLIMMAILLLWSGYTQVIISTVEWGVSLSRNKHLLQTICARLRLARHHKCERSEMQVRNLAVKHVELSNDQRILKSPTNCYTLTNRSIRINKEVRIKALTIFEALIIRKFLGIYDEGVADDKGKIAMSQDMAILTTKLTRKRREQLNVTLIKEVARVQPRETLIVTIINGLMAGCHPK